MGILVDNTHSRFGKFKPWIAIGGIIGGILTVLLFTDLGLTGAGYIISFVFIYLAWDLTYGANDIAYWSMLPSLTIDQKERENTGSFARICANVGMYIVVVGILPITGALGGGKKAWFILAVGVAVFTLVFLCFTLFGVKENRALYKEEETTSLKEMFGVLFKNDQLLFTAISMALFMIGYSITTSFGVYFFIYAFKDENMYPRFRGCSGRFPASGPGPLPCLLQKIQPQTAIRLLDCFSRPRLYSIFLLSHEHNPHWYCRRADLHRPGLYSVAHAGISGRYRRVRAVEAWPPQ